MTRFIFKCQLFTADCHAVVIDWLKHSRYLRTFLNGEQKEEKEEILQGAKTISSPLPFGGFQIGWSTEFYN